MGLLILVRMRPSLVENNFCKGQEGCSIYGNVQYYFFCTIFNKSIYEQNILYIAPSSRFQSHVNELVNES